MASLPWLLTALPREHSAFRPLKVATVRRQPSAWNCILDDREFLLAETGMGGATVQQTLAELGQLTTPSFVFLAGFGGALDSTLRVGDAIRAEAVIGPDGVSHRATLSVPCHFSRGTILTSDRLIGSPEEKRRLAEATGAKVVDMESSYVAAWCEERNVPWGCLRVVTDEAQTPISKDVFDLLENGHVSAWRLTRALVRRPTILGELLQLGRATNVAAEVIAKAFAASV